MFHGELDLGGARARDVRQEAMLGPAPWADARSTSARSTSARRTAPAYRVQQRRLHFLEKVRNVAAHSAGRGIQPACHTSLHRESRGSRGTRHPNLSGACRLRRLHTAVFDGGKHGIEIDGRGSGASLSVEPGQSQGVGWSRNTRCQ